MNEDPLDTVLNLEDSIYHDAYAQGQRDGTRTGLIEGHLFGLQKGYEKFTEMGRLHGRALVWASRLPAFAMTGMASDLPDLPVPANPPSDGPSTGTDGTLQPLHSHGRLGKHVAALLALTDPADLAVTNDDHAVDAYDERFRRAVAKARIIGRMIGEDPGLGATNAQDAESRGRERDVAAYDESNIEDLGVRRIRHAGPS